MRQLCLRDIGFVDCSAWQTHLIFILIYIEYLFLYTSTNLRFVIMLLVWISVLSKSSDVFRVLVLSYLPNPSARAGYDTRSIFKRSLTGLNSEFSFSETCCLAEAEETVCPTIYSWREINWTYTFPNYISAMWYAISLVQDLNLCRRVHFLRR